MYVCSGYGPACTSVFYAVCAMDALAAFIQLYTARPQLTCTSYIIIYCMVCAQQANLSEFRGHCVYGHTNTLTCYKGGLRKSVNCDYNVCATLYNLVAILDL